MVEMSDSIYGAENRYLIKAESSLLYAGTLKTSYWDFAGLTEEVIQPTAMKRSATPSSTTLICGYL